MRLLVRTLAALPPCIVVWFAACSQNNSDRPHEQALAEYGYRPLESGTGGGDGAQRSSSAPAYPTDDSGAGKDSDRHSLKGLSVSIPEGWGIVPPSGMRLAEYTLPGNAVNEVDATLTVFYFGPTQGGSVEANIERWYGQFTQPDGGSTRERSRRWESEVSGMPVTHVDIAGEFSGGMAPMAGGGASRPGYRMLGSIVMAPIGPYFFKLVGPEATVQHWAARYDDYIASILTE